MEISKEKLLQVAVKLGISKQQVESLWSELENTQSSKTSAFSKLLFYFGALIIISAMSWFMNLSWEWFGGLGIFFIALIYAIFFALLGAHLWKKPDLKVPAGLFITVAVCMTPLAIYGLETYFNIWPQDTPENYRDFFSLIKGSWIFMEVGTILAGIIALKFFPFPFITAPIFFACWFLAMDTIPLILGKEATWEQKEWVSLFFGLLILGIAYVIDRKNKKDYAFWGYLFGTLTFWVSLTSITSDKGEVVLFLYLFINVLMMFFSILLKRKVLIIFGAIGTFIYISHLAYEIFKDSILFPFVLSIIGLIIIYLGILYQRHYLSIEEKVHNIFRKS